MHPGSVSLDTTEFKKKDELCMITSHESFVVSRRNVWINRGQSWTRGQKCALWTAWNDSSTPASSSWTDWNRLSGARARFPRPWQTNKCRWKDSRHTRTARAALWSCQFLTAFQTWLNCPLTWEKEQRCHFGCKCLRLTTHTFLASCDVGLLAPLVKPYCH